MFSLFGWLCLTVVVCFELRGWDSAEVVKDAAVVEPVDPFEGGDFEVFEAAPGSFVSHEFGLVEAVDGLGESVVVGIAAGADGVRLPNSPEVLSRSSRRST